MSPRNGNYTSFYVEEPFISSSVKSNQAPDFVYYHQLKIFKDQDSTFPFIDAHNGNYNVRDTSYWDSTLKPRIRERLQKSKNILLILSSFTKQSRALKEEIDYGINNQGLPVIVIYPEYPTEESMLEFNRLNRNIKKLWTQIPIFQTLQHKVPTLHIPMNINTIKRSLENDDFRIFTKREDSMYMYT